VETFSVRVNPEFAGTPTGSVTVKTGSTVLCTVPSLTAGAGSCALSEEQLGGRSYTVVATHAGNVDFDPAAASGAVKVVAAASKTALSLSTARVALGQEEHVVFNVTVTTSDGATATGTVTIASGSTKLCTATLSAGHGHCSPTASALPAGAHAITASYAGNTDVAASHSTSATLTVTPAASPRRADAVGPRLHRLPGFGRRVVDD
jgi:hypothetical protein